MNRIKVSVEGRHPALPLVHKWLISHGARITSSNDANFRILGGYGRQTLVANRIPTLVLSSSDVYWSSGTVSSFAEDYTIIVPSTRDISAFPSVQCLYAEAESFARSSSTLVLRPFNIYGPNIKEGFTRTFIEQAKIGNSITIPAPGYQERTFLFEDDFIEFFSLFWAKFVDGLSGIYNIGSVVPISINRSADIVWQRTRGVRDQQAPVHIENLPFKLQWSVIPDMTRTHAEVSHKASTSLSSGIWITRETSAS